jgi:tetratricopeptide (TPR) repeat protein
MAAKMKTLANQLAAAGALDFEDHWNVIEGAVGVEDWSLVRDYCARAGELANAETIKAESPNREITATELENAVNDRVGKLMVKDAWARANQGQVDEALAAFAEANKLVPRYYFDIPEYDLYVYWGNALLNKGDFSAAVEFFADNALIMQNEEALAGLKAAYAGLNGSEDGFDAYADKLHLRIAPTIDDFQLPDYEGTRRFFSDLRDEVTLLVLWFPT